MGERAAPDLPAMTTGPESGLDKTKKGISLEKTTHSVQNLLRYRARSTPGRLTTALFTLQLHFVPWPVGPA